MSGEDRNRVNCYSIYLAPNENAQLDFRVERLVEAGFLGAVCENEVFNVPACLSNENSSSSHLVVYHFYRGQRNRYNGLWDFAFGEVSYYAFRQFWLERLKQFLFNRRTDFRRDRIDLLRALVDYDLKKTNFSRSVIDETIAESEFDLFSELYGYRVFGHPKYESEYRRFRMLLQSLEESGDIEVQNRRIAIRGKSLKTISDFELEERRHRDLFAMQIILSILTAVLAIAAVIEAFT